MSGSSGEGELSKLDPGRDAGLGEHVPQVKVHGPRGEEQLRGDFTVGQALLNLVDNAIKYSPVGGRIAVRVSTTVGGMAVLDVSDTGPGIPADLRPRVFDRFYRADRSRSRENGGGTGLGLSIARWAVEVNGGRLTLESSDGTGATFRITLPNTV